MRIFSTILAVIMALSICGMTANAEEAPEGKTGTVAIFNDSKYNRIEFTEAVEKGYIEEFSSYRIGVFCAASTIDDVIFPGGKLLTVDEIKRDNYNECLVFLSTSNGKFFLRLVNEEGYEPEGTLEEIYPIGISFETVSSDDASTFMFEGIVYYELTSHQLTTEYFDWPGFWLTMQLLFIGDHTLGLYPMLSGMLCYWPEGFGTEAINYIIETETESFTVGSPAEGHIVAVIRENQEVILPEKSDVGPCVYVKDIDQMLGEDLTILFVSYGENFFVKIHVVDDSAFKNYDDNH